MIFHYEVEQRTPQWHELRWGKISGTRSAGLLGKSGTLVRDILSEKLEDFNPLSCEDGYVSEEMQRGIDLEPEARHYLSQYTGIEFLDCGFIDSTEYPLLGISPDGISKCETIQCEIKSPQKEAFTEMLMTGSVTDAKHLCQIIHAFAVNSKLKSNWFIGYRPESKKPAFIKEFTRDTLVDLGTKAKPVVKSVQQWVDFEIENLNTLEKEVSELYNQITGI